MPQRITKEIFYAYGGLSNRNLFRKEWGIKSPRWTYWACGAIF